MLPMLYIGCAGWTIPARFSSDFPTAGSHLEGYARVLPASQINTTFYRPHRAATWERWANAVQADFRFAVKAPRTITHERSFSGAKGDLVRFFDQVLCLGRKLGPILFQTPPKLVLDAKVTAKFFTVLRAMYSGQVV